MVRSTYRILNEVEASFDGQHKLSAKFICHANLHFKGHANVVPASQIFVHKHCIVRGRVRLVGSGFLWEQVVEDRPTYRYVRTGLLDDPASQDHAMDSTTNHVKIVHTNGVGRWLIVPVFLERIELRVHVTDGQRASYSQGSALTSLGFATCTVSGCQSTTGGAQSGQIQIQRNTGTSGGLSQGTTESYAGYESQMSHTTAVLCTIARCSFRHRLGCWTYSSTHAHTHTQS